MSGLAALQADFARYLLDQPGGLQSRLGGKGHAGVERRLQVYRHAYGARLREALATDHPKLAALAGHDFAALANAYVAAHPSRSFSLRRLGAALPGFLAAAPPWSARPALAAMAAFEEALADAFDAADDPVLPLRALAEVAAADWPGLRLVPHPATIRLRLAVDAPALWRALEHGEPAPEKATMTSDPGVWLVWRQGLEVRFRPLPPEEAAAFDAMAEGADFAQLCDAVAGIVGAASAPLRVVELVRLWTGTGIISALLPPGGPPREQ
jgi:hypothetical protein